MDLLVLPEQQIGEMVVLVALEMALLEQQVVLVSSSSLTQPLDA
jgi:hypothetical protein